MRPSPPGSGVPPPRGLPRGGGRPDPSDPGETPILGTDPDPGVFGKRGTLGAKVPAPTPSLSLMREEGREEEGRGSAEKVEDTLWAGAEFDQPFASDIRLESPAWRKKRKKEEEKSPHLSQLGIYHHLRRGSSVRDL